MMNLYPFTINTVYSFYQAHIFNTNFKEWDAEDTETLLPITLLTGHGFGPRDDITAIKYDSFL